MFVFLKYLTKIEYGSQMCRNNFKISFPTAHHLQPLKKDPTGDIVKDISVLGKLAFCKLSAAFFFGGKSLFQGLWDIFQGFN